VGAWNGTEWMEVGWFELLLHRRPKYRLPINNQQGYRAVFNKLSVSGWLSAPFMQSYAKKLRGKSGRVGWGLRGMVHLPNNYKCQTLEKAFIMLEK